VSGRLDEDEPEEGRQRTERARGDVAGQAVGAAPVRTGHDRGGGQPLAARQQSNEQVGDHQFEQLEDDAEPSDERAAFGDLARPAAGRDQRIDQAGGDSDGRRPGAGRAERVGRLSRGR
jgi:hypothetical protein